MNAYHPEVAARAGHRREYCLAPEVIFNSRLEVEHVIPKHHKGTDEFDNLALACRACNAFNSDFQVAKDDETGETVRLFHPRTDSWREHFEFHAETAEIRGISAIGKATVARLNFNCPSQREARRQWMRLGLFP